MIIVWSTNILNIAYWLVYRHSIAYYTVLVRPSFNRRGGEREGREERRKERKGEKRGEREEKVERERER